MLKDSVNDAIKKASKHNNLKLQGLLREKFELKLIFDKISKLYFLETFYYAEDHFFELLDQVETSNLNKVLEKFKVTFKEIIQSLDLNICESETKENSEGEKKVEKSKVDSVREKLRQKA
jgi:TRAP-type mannitol/chloroaromatic compound transport system substrate-binding protein